jgi:hypothetical protein
MLAAAEVGCDIGWNAAHERTPMAKQPERRDFPVNRVRRYLEPGPIVLVSSRWEGEANVMTLGWHTVLEFTPLAGRLHDRGRQPQLPHDPRQS